MSDAPFDVLGPLRQRQRLSSTGSVFPDPGYVPSDPDQSDPSSFSSAPTPFQSQEQDASDQGQQLLAQQARQAHADAQAQQKAALAQQRVDQDNAEATARADAENSKSNGVVTQAQPIPGPSGKDVVTQVPQQNPDGTTAYVPADLGVKADDQGSAFRVRRNQFGALDWSDPYQAGTNANIALNKDSQVIATPKGKDANELPKKDVSTQGVTTGGAMTDSAGNVIQDSRGNPLPDIKVAANAPINDPAIQSGLNDQEQVLVKSAAAQHVKDTLGDAADNAADAYGKATADHTAAAANVVAAAVAAKNSDGDDSSQGDFDKARAALKTAQANLDQTHHAHEDAKTAYAIAKNDPLAYLQSQPPGDGSPDPNDPWHQVAEKSGIPYDKLVNAVGTSLAGAQMADQANVGMGDLSDAIAAGKVAAPLQPQDSAAAPVAQAQTSPADDSTGNSQNTITGLITGQPPADASPPPAEKGTWGSWLANMGTKSLGAFESTIGTMMQGVGTAADAINPGKSLGLNSVADAVTKAFLSPADFERFQAERAPKLVTVAGSRLKANADALSQGTGLKLPNLGQFGSGSTLRVDPNRQDVGTKIASGAAGMLPMIAGGEFETPLWITNGYQSAVDDAKAQGDSALVTQAKGLIGGVTMGGVSKLFKVFGAPATKYNPLLWGTQWVADGTTSPLLKILQGGAKTATADLLMQASKLAGKGAVEGAGFSEGGQVASGNNPYAPADAQKNTSDDASSASSLAALQTLLGTFARGKSLYQVSKGVDDLVDTVNQARSNPPAGQAAQPPVDRATVISGLIQQNQMARAHDSFATLQKQYATIDNNTVLTPQQRMGMKMKATVDVPPELRPAIMAHLDASADAQRQVDEAMATADAEQAKLPPASAGLPNRSDAYIEANKQDILQAQQTGQPRQRQLIGNETDAGILAESDRRAQIAALAQQRGQVVAGIASSLKDSLDQTASLSQTPEGRSALLSLNRYNAAQPAGASKASASTLQDALDLAPNPTGNVAVPATYVEHYLPLAHQIEQLPDPDQQTMATAAVKLTNGRALTGDEQNLMLGDPTTGQPGAVDATTQKPLASVTSGKTILTQAGLDRLKYLVPAAADVLPRNEQAAIEAQPPPLPPSAKGKGAQLVSSSPPVDSVTGRAPHVPAGNFPRPDPALAHVPTENLQNQIVGMQAAMAKTRAGGGDMPPSAHSQLARLQQEVAARSRPSVVADDAAFGAPAGHHVDETISFTHPGPDGRPVQSRGDVTEVHPNYYRVATDDGTEHRVPIIEQSAAPVPKGNQVATNRAVEDYRTGKADENLTRTRLRNVGFSDDEIHKRLAPPVSDEGTATESAKPKTTAPKIKATDLPGVDVSTIKPEQAEAATLLRSTYAKVRATAKALGIDGFRSASHPEGQIGLGIHPDDLSKIELDLPRLTQELAKLPTSAARQAKVDDVVDEELRHVALETVAGDHNGTHSPAQADTTFARLWSSASPFQRRTAIDLYDKGALAFVDPDGAANGSHGTLENASDANKGREYMRMLSQLQAHGRTSEIADLLTPETKTFFQRVAEYLRHVFTKVNDPAAKQLLDRTEELLQMHPEPPAEDEPSRMPADIALANGDNIPARYEVAELGDIQPSHRNGSPNPVYPAGLNERDYSQPEEKQKNEAMVASFDPRRVLTDNPDAVNGPPIVDRSGIVLGGNRRAIMLSDPRAYGKYKPYLQANAERFGLDPDQVAKMHQPVLIRRVDTAEAQRPELIRRLNETPTGGIDTANDAVSAGKQITPDLVKTVSDLFQQDPDKTSLQHLTDGDTKAIAQGLLDTGAIRPNDKEKYIATNGNLSPEGARFARSVLLGGILPDANLLREINDTPTQTKLLNGLSSIYTMKARGVDIAPLQEAVGLEADRQRLGIKNVVEHQAQGHLSGIRKEPTTEGKTLQSFLAGIKGNEARRAFTQLQSLVAPIEPGQVSLFGEANRRSLADVSDAEMNKVLAGAKKISREATALRRAGVGAAGVTGATYPGPLKLAGMIGLHPEQAEVEGRFARWIQSDPDRAAAEYAKIPDAEGGRVIDMDVARALSPDYRASRRSKTIHSISTQKPVNALATQKLLADAGASLRPGDVMGLTAGGPGSGKGNIKKIAPEAWYGARFVYDGVLRHQDFANQLIADATAKGARTAIWYAHVPIETAVEQAVGRAEKDGRSLPLFTLSSGHYDAQRTMIALLRQHAHNPNAELRVFDLSRPDATDTPNPLQFLTENRNIYKDADETLARARAAYDAIKDRLTDPVAREIFETGSYPPEATLHPPPEQWGGRIVAGGSGGFADEQPESTSGSPAGETGQQHPAGSSAAATSTAGTDGDEPSGSVTNPFATVPLENVRRVRDTLSQLQAQGRPLNETQKQLLAFAQDHLAGAVGGAGIRDTGTGNLFDRDETPPENQTRADEVPLTQTQALTIYKSLGPRRQAGEILAASAARLLERAERTLGQSFIPGMDETSSSRAEASTPPPSVNFGKPKTGIRAELQTEGPDMFGSRPPGQQALFGSGVRELPMDLPGQRSLDLGPETSVRSPVRSVPPSIGSPLRRYINALHQADLSLGIPGQRPLDFARQYETDFGTPPDASLIAGAGEIQKAGRIETTPRERFEGNLDLADRIAARFDNTPGTTLEDRRQVARMALHNAAERHNPIDGVPFRGRAARFIRNALIDLQRKQKRQALEQPTLDAPLTETGTTGKDNVRADESSAHQAVAQAESHTLLRSEVGKLPQAVREVAEGLLAGESQTEIAARRGYSPQRANYLAAAALTKLKQAFQAKGLGKTDLMGGAGVRTDRAARYPGDIRNDREVGLTPDELRDEHTATMRQIGSSLMHPEDKGKRMKAEAMRFSSKMRHATGNLTDIEAANKRRFEDSNYKGKPVSVDGKEATVVGPVFGKVRVKYADGSTELRPADEIQPDHAAIHGAGVRAPLSFDLEGQSFADAKDAFDKDDVDTWPIAEEDRDRLRKFSGDPKDNDEYTNLAELADQMKEQGWPHAIVAKAGELRDEMAKHFETGAADLKEGSKHVEAYLDHPDRQTAHDTDLDDTDTWPDKIKDQWDSLEPSDPTTWPAGMESDAQGDGAISETPVDEDETNGETEKEVDEEYAQAWMADHLVAPEVRRAMEAVPEGSDINSDRTDAVLDHMARTEAERRLQGSPEKNALDQTTQGRDDFARNVADRRGLKGYAPYISNRNLRIHDGDWQDHKLTPAEDGQATELHRAHAEAYRAHEAAVDRETNNIRPPMEANHTARWDDSRVDAWKRDNATEGEPERPADAQGSLFGAGVSDAEKQKALSKFALGFDSFARHDVAPTARTVADGIKTAGDGFVKLFAPQLRGEPAARTARSLSAALAEAARDYDRAVEWTKDAHQVFDRMSPADNHAFMDAVEKNTKAATPELEAIRQLLAKTNHGYVDLVRSMPGQHFVAVVTHYLPHIWDLSDLGDVRKNFAEILRQRYAPSSALGSASLELHPDTEAPVLRVGNRLLPLDGAEAKWASDILASKNSEAAVQRFYQRKIGGSRAFLKQRVIPSIEEGRSLGLKLVSNNPVDLYLTRWKQMGKYVAGQRVMDEMKQTDNARPFEDPNDAPPGWKRVDDRLGLSTETYTDPKTGKVRTRNAALYAPAQVVDVLDNYLSPGLRNHPNALVSGAFKIINGAANLLNSAQLGFSAFHLGFTTVDASTSKLAIAIEHAAMGDVAGAVKHAALAPAQFLSPAQMLIGYVGDTIGRPEWDTHMGSKLLREWNAPGTQGAEIGRLVNAIVQGGGRVRLDPMYSDQWMKALGKAWRQGNYPGVAMRLPFATLEAVMKPIMEYVVPRQKLAAFADLAKLEMKKLGPNASEDDLRRAMQKASASIDNRMGQLVYDNLHWNKTVKDLAMISTRSVGWNLGTAREIGGGAFDAAKFIKDKATGQKAEFTHRMAYCLAMHVMLAGMGTLAGYLLTGKRPESLTDMFFPKTGEKDQNGHDVRLAFPTYGKDEAAYLHAPGTTVGNKLNPLWSSVLQVIENKDYYGRQIYGPDDNGLTKAGDIAKFAGKQVEPFAWTGGNQFSKDVAPGDNVGPLRQLVGSKLVHEALSAGPTIGVTPAAKYLSTSPAEQRAEELEARVHAGDTRTQAEYEKTQAKATLRTLIAQSNNDGKVVGPAIRDAIKAGTIKRDDVSKLRDDAKLSSLERMARDISNQYERKGQSVEGYQALRSVWDKATAEEQRTLVRYIMPLYNKVAKTPGANVGPRPVVKAGAKQPAGEQVSMSR